MEQQQPPDRVDPERYGYERPEYLASHKSLAACQREISRFTNELIAELEAIADRDGEKAVVRRTPERCIIQLDLVAMTVAWLRTTVDSVAGGELLVMVWQGTIAGRANFSPERKATMPVNATASIQWQDTLSAEATSEDTWKWRSTTGSEEALNSKDLVAACIGELTKALNKARKAA